MKKNTKCYIYTRVSTAIQVDGYSLDAQKDKLKKYAEFQDMEIVGEYSDERATPTFFDMHFLKNILRKWFSYLENAILALSKDEQKISDFCSSLYNLNFKTNLLTPI